MLKVVMVNVFIPLRGIQVMHAREEAIWSDGMRFVDIVTENNAVNCTALLLDYQQKYCENANPIADFTLDCLD